MIFERFRKTKAEQPPMTRAEIASERAEIEKQLAEITATWDKEYKPDGNPESMEILRDTLKAKDDRLRSRRFELDMMKPSDEQ